MLGIRANRRRVLYANMHSARILVKLKMERFLKALLTKSNRQTLPVQTLRPSLLSGAGWPPASLPDVPVAYLDAEAVVAVELDPGLVEAEPVEPADLLGGQLAHLVVAPGLGGLAGWPRPGPSHLTRVHVWDGSWTCNFYRINLINN